MAIGALIEALMPGGGGGTAAGGEPPAKDEKGLKEWIRSKLKALASLLGQLNIKAAEALPGIVGVIISWVLNKATDVAGWVSQNLWGSGCRSWWVDLYLYGNQKVIILRIII